MKHKVSAIDLNTGKLLNDHMPDAKSLAIAIEEKFLKWDQERLTKQERWLEMWAHYLGSPEATQHLRSKVGEMIGEINDDWRHRINTGKAYSIIETAVAYLAGATFPNNDYLEVKPDEPGIRQESRVLTKWMLNKLRQANVTSKWEMYLRQLLITGFSVIALPWVVNKKMMKRNAKRIDPEGILEGMDLWDIQEYEKITYNNTKLEVLSCFDVYIDPYADDMQEASMFRILHKTMADVVKGYADGTYDQLPIAELLSMPRGTREAQNDSYKQDVATFNGLDYDPNKKVECKEYWGTIEVGDFVLENVVVTTINKKVARLIEIPYWAGKPFIVGSPVPVPTQPYGLGILEPVRGMLHENNVLTNQRLDGQEIVINPTFTIMPDGVADPDSVYTAPGHFIEVQDPNAIRQLQTNSNVFAVTYTEQQVLNQNIDEATGISAYVGTQPGRNAERVTAAEVNAVREAGGNRLSSIHKHIEQTQFIPFLEKWLYLAQQFVLTEQMIEVQGDETGVTHFMGMSPEVLQHQYRMHVVGADFLTKREKVLSDVLAYVETVIQVPEWQAMINWEELLLTVTQKFNLADDVERLVIRGIQEKRAQQEMQAQALPEDPLSQTLNTAQQTGGAAGRERMASVAQTLGPDAAQALQQAEMSGMSSEQAQQAVAATQLTQ